MTTREALLRSVLENPADDTARLVYADLLQEESEHERAEFIRAQVELSTFDDAYYLSYDNRSMCENSAVPLIKRTAELLHPAWSKDICEMLLPPVMANDWIFRRGFISEITLPTATFFEHAAAIFAAHPVERVRLTDREPFVHPAYNVVPMPPPSQWGAIWPAAILRGNQREDEHSSPWVLPLALRELLRRREFPYAEFNDAFTPEDAAHAEASWACVAYGRSLAGLPPLPQ